MKQNKLTKRQARIEIAQLLDEAAGTYYELFIDMYDPSFVKFTYQRVLNNLLHNKYSERTYRRLCFMMFWFIEYAKPHYNYETITFYEPTSKYCHCKHGEDEYHVVFTRRDNIYVPDEIHKAWNRQKQTLEEYFEQERKYRIHYIEPLY